MSNEKFCSKNIFAQKILNQKKWDKKIKDPKDFKRQNNISKKYFSPKTKSVIRTPILVCDQNPPLSL